MPRRNPGTFGSTNKTISQFQPHFSSVIVGHIFFGFLLTAKKQVFTLQETEYKKLKAKLSSEAGNNLVLCKQNPPKVTSIFIVKLNPRVLIFSFRLYIVKCCSIQTWLVGDGLSETEQLKASKGTIFVPYSQFPPKKTRKDCSYNSTPAMLAPKHLENVDSCEVRNRNPSPSNHCTICSLNYIIVIYQQPNKNL